MRIVLFDFTGKANMELAAVAAASSERQPTGSFPVRKKRTNFNFVHEFIAASREPIVCGGPTTPFLHSVCSWLWLTGVALVIHSANCLSWRYCSMQANVIRRFFSFGIMPSLPEPKKQQSSANSHCTPCTEKMTVARFRRKRQS